jgi:hypothetical protein
MIKRNGFWLTSGTCIGAFVVVAALSNGGCSAASTALQAAQGCDEFPSAASTLQLDANTQAFVQATADLISITGTLESSVYTACANMAKDLGVTDSWSAQPSLDAQMQAACTAAQTAIAALLSADGGAQAQAQCTLNFSGGECTVNVDAEASCYAMCSGSASCTPPTANVACQPGDLSVECDGMCEANAVCEGSVMAAATCNGSCSGACTGMCDANAASGSHCAGVCSGTCTGECKIQAGAMVSCGANVRCRGGCTTTGTAPQCEGEITPPSCQTNAQCQASCQGNVEATATCTPPAATLDCGASASSNLQALITTVSTNMPAILSAITDQGDLAVKAAVQVGKTAAVVTNNLASLTGKAVACAGVALKGAVNASYSVQVTFTASASVSGSCGGPAPTPPT